MALWVISHVLTCEDRLAKAFNGDYEAALAKAWYGDIVAERPGEGRKDVFEWLLTTAQIDKLDLGTMTYDDMLTKSHYVEHSDFGKGIQISRNDFEDDMFSFALDRAQQLGTSAALHPQTLAEDLIKNGHQTANKSYDGVPFFSASHPVFDAAGTTYANVFTGCALTADNFSAQVGKIQSYKMPNGVARNLEVTHLLVPPALRKAALEITSGEFLGQASGGTNQNVLKSYGVKVVVIPALAGADTTWYLSAQEPGQLGRPLIYSRRRAFEMTSYDGSTQQQLASSNMLDWQIRGRAGALYGHPYLMTKQTA